MDQEVDTSFNSNQTYKIRELMNIYEDKLKLLQTYIYIEPQKGTSIVQGNRV